MRSQIGWYAFQLALTALLVWMLWQSGVTFDGNAQIANMAIVVWLFVWVTTVYLSYFFNWWRSRRSERDRASH